MRAGLGTSSRDPGAGERAAWLVPAAVALSLALPAFQFPFIWDDYTFLNEARSFSAKSLLHHKPLDPFYRPLSREVYFAVIHGLGRYGPLVGHLLNSVFLISSIVLLYRLVSRMIGPRGGLIAGIVFASMGVLPFLIGWVSGIQDLLAIFFILLALDRRLKGDGIGAVLAAVAALFSKESAFMFLPVIALVPWIRGKSLRSAVRGMALYGALGVGWALAHPGIRGLFARHFGARETDYVGGVTPLAAAGHLGRYLLTLLNFPQPDSITHWPAAKTAALVLGLLALILGLRLSRILPDEAGPASPWPRKRVLAAAAYMMLAPLLLTAVTVQGWSPYYAGIGGLGFSILAAALLRHAPSRALAIGAIPFVALGVWQRGQEFEAGMTTERNFEQTTVALAKIESGFRTLQPTLPEDARVVVSVQVRAIPGIYLHIYHLQALREWYDNPTIDVVRPEIRRTRPRPESFFIITRDQQVLEMNASTFSIRPAGLELEYSSGERALRAYALGWYASGDADRAAAILTQMPEIDRGLQASHYRLAAALLTAAGRGEEARKLLTDLPRLPREYELTNIAAFLAEPLPGEPLDLYVLDAFGIPRDDRQALLWLASWYRDKDYARAGLRFIRRYLTLEPNDPKGRTLLADLERIERKRRQYDLPEEDGPPRGW